MHGVVAAIIEHTKHLVTRDFLLVSKQVEFPFSGLLGRDFFQNNKAVISYGTYSIRLKERLRKLCELN